MNLKKLFRPKSLALIGGYWADFVYDGNKTIGFKGKVWHVNPSRKSSKAKKYYKAIQDKLIDDCVVIPSSDLNVQSVSRSDIVGLKPNPAYSTLLVYKLERKSD